MSFLNPALLLALPLMALPIIIHLINQRRYQSVRWAAMMFLLAANKMSRGYARIRQWLILACRTAAVAGLIFAVSRPLAGGWLGLTAGGTPDTTIVILDRSPSTSQGAAAGTGSKLATGVRQLASTLATLGSGRWVLIDSGTGVPRELESLDALVASPATGPAASSADLPALLTTARDYLRDNKSGRTEVWICSDTRSNDWDPESGRWPALRDAFQALPQGTRFHLLAYPEPAPENVAVRVSEVRRRKSAEGQELLVTLRLTRPGLVAAGPAAAGEKRTVPVTFEIDGARSELPVELVGAQFELKEHRIPLAAGSERGWGRVSIPADDNPADDEFYFVYSDPPVRKTVVVADDPQVASVLQLAAEVPPESSLVCTAETVGPDQLATVTWDEVALVLWQGPLPKGEAAELLTAFLDRGGRLILFPPREADAGSYLGLTWTTWTEPQSPVGVENWRNDQDLLANSRGGLPLPVGRVEVRRWCGLTGELTPLAGLKGGAPLLARAATPKGAAYVCTTTPSPADSTLATEGVSLYVLVQRALADGAGSLGTTRQLDAGAATLAESIAWERLAGPTDAVSTESAIQPGAYRAGERLLAVNRTEAEDAGAPLAADRVAGLFQGLSFSRVDDQAGSLGSLIQEIWRVFLICMLVALVGEALLCLPRRMPQAAPSFPGATGS